MIRINLLPHREAKRVQRKKDFVLTGILTVAAAGAVVFFGGTYLNAKIDAQNARNKFITEETKKLDEQIKEIANLRQELASLKARQTAVENLQSDRTLPVHLLDELVKHMPDGVHLKGIKQEDLKVSIAGLAQSNERVSELLRAAANNTPWLEKPELIEIKAISLAAQPGKEGRRVYEFTMNALLKRPAKSDDKPAVTAAAPSAPNGLGAPSSAAAVAGMLPGGVSNAASAASNQQAAATAATK